MTSVVELSQVAGLRLDSLPEVKIGLVKDSKGEVLAREALIKYTPSQAYVVLQALDKSIAGKDIKVASEDELHLKLITVETEKENRRLLPIAQQFHSVPSARRAECHLSDMLAAHSLGRFNLELKKNVTIDAFELVDSWRDDAGFIVTDRNVFAQLTFDSDKLIKSLSPSTQEITPYTSADLDGLCDFDNSVCGFSRDAYVELLVANSSILIAKSGAIDGLVAGKGEQIYAVYAETMELAHALVKAYIETNKLKQVTLFSRDGIWECEPVKSRSVYRRHTRTVPSAIKWPKVYALNMGVHIV